MSSQPNPAALDADDFKITTPLPGVAHGAATPGGPEPGPIPVRRLWFPFFTPLRNLASSRTCSASRVRASDLERMVAMHWSIVLIVINALVYGYVRRVIEQELSR